MSCTSHSPVAVTNTVSLLQFARWECCYIFGLRTILLVLPDCLIESTLIFEKAQNLLTELRPFLQYPGGLAQLRMNILGQRRVYE